MTDWIKYIGLGIVVLGAAMGYGVLLYKVEVVLGNQDAIQQYISSDQVEDAKIHTRQDIEIDNLEKHHD